MLRVAVLVSGGGTNLQAIIDAVGNGTITNTELVGVISNNKNAYALTRAGNHQIPAQCVSPKDFETREEFNKVFLEKVDELKPDLIVLAGFLVVIPEEMISRYRNKIINIHPSLIPSFCGTGYYGLKVHEAARYTGGSAETCDGAGGVEDPSTCDRPDRKWKSNSKRWQSVNCPLEKEEHQ